MSAIGGRQYGVTGPLSTALPTEAEKKQTDLLLDELRRENNFEEQAETNKRYVSLLSTARCSAATSRLPSTIVNNDG